MSLPRHRQNVECRVHEVTYKIYVCVHVRMQVHGTYAKHTVATSTSRGGGEGGEGGDGPRTEKDGRNAFLFNLVAVRWNMSAF